MFQYCPNPQQNFSMVAAVLFTIIVTVIIRAYSLCLTHHHFYCLIDRNTQSRISLPGRKTGLWKHARCHPSDKATRLNLWKSPTTKFTRQTITTKPANISVIRQHQRKPKSHSEPNQQAHGWRQSRAGLENSWSLERKVCFGTHKSNITAARIQALQVLCLRAKGEIFSCHLFSSTVVKSVILSLTIPLQEKPGIRKPTGATLAGHGEVTPFPTEWLTCCCRGTHRCDILEAIQSHGPE